MQVKFKLSIDCGNSAFDENQNAETARILRELADRIEREQTARLPDDFWISDCNGNRVGKAVFFYAGRNAL